MHKKRLATLLLGAVAAATPLLADTQVTGSTPGGAFFQIVVPDEWNGDLVIWNHGFSLSEPGPVSDLGPLVDAQLLEGFAIAASSYRESGWALFKSNNDLRALVQVFTEEFDEPERIFLFGASLGGIVNAAAIEKGKLGNVVGAFTICGAVAGSRNWDGGLDLRLLYDQVCSGIPEAMIPGGAEGLPKNSDMSGADVEAAVNACTGVDLPESERSKKQKKNLRKLIKLSGFPLEFLQTDMSFATHGLADLIHDKGKLKGRQGVGNENVDYGDAKVNRKIERVRPSKKGAKKLAKSFTPKGKVGDTKIIALQTDKDGLVIVENLGEYAEVVPPENLTIGVVVEDEPSHCGFSVSEVLANWEELLDWVDGDPQPTTADLQAACENFAPVFGGDCRIDPDFVIPDMDGRIRPRDPNSEN